MILTDFELEDSVKDNVMLRCFQSINRSVRFIEWKVFFMCSVNFDIKISFELRK